MRAAYHAAQRLSVIIEAGSIEARSMALQVLGLLLLALNSPRVTLPNPANVCAAPRP